jgi:hypothetical protein
MVGLTTILPLICCCFPTAQDSTDLQAVHAQRLESLLDNPRPGSYWQNTVFQSVTRLEHHHTQLSLRPWRALNSPVSDASISNILVFSRRNQLSLPLLDNAEAANSTLERALALWGEMKFTECQQMMTSAAIVFANDLRFVNNLAWLSMEPQPQLSATADTRELCQAVLAFKSPLH